MAEVLDEILQEFDKQFHIRQKQNQNEEAQREGGVLKTSVKKKKNEKKTQEKKPRNNRNRKATTALNLKNVNKKQKGTHQKEMIKTEIAETNKKKKKKKKSINSKSSCSGLDSDLDLNSCLDMSVDSSVSLDSEGYPEYVCPDFVLNKKRKDVYRTLEEYFKFCSETYRGVLAESISSAAQIFPTYAYFKLTQKCSNKCRTGIKKTVFIDVHEHMNKRVVAKKPGNVSRGSSILHSVFNCFSGDGSANGIVAVGKKKKKSYNNNSLGNVCYSERVSPLLQCMIQTAQWWNWDYTEMRFFLENHAMWKTFREVLQSERLLMHLNFDEERKKKKEEEGEKEEEELPRDQDQKRTISQLDLSIEMNKRQRNFLAHQFNPMDRGTFVHDFLGEIIIANAMNIFEFDNRNDLDFDCFIPGRIVSPIFPFCGCTPDGIVCRRSYLFEALLQKTSQDVFSKSPRDFSLLFSRDEKIRQLVCYGAPLAFHEIKVISKKSATFKQKTISDIRRRGELLMTEMSRVSAVSSGTVSHSASGRVKEINIAKNKDYTAEAVVTEYKNLFAEICVLFENVLEKHGQYLEPRGLGEKEEEEEEEEKEEGKTKKKTRKRKKTTTITPGRCRKIANFGLQKYRMHKRIVGRDDDDDDDDNGRPRYGKPFFDGNMNTWKEENAIPHLFVPHDSQQNAPVVNISSILNTPGSAIMTVYRNNYPFISYVFPKAPLALKPSSDHYCQMLTQALNGYHLNSEARFVFSLVTQTEFEERQNGNASAAVDVAVTYSYDVGFTKEIIDRYGQRILQEMTEAMFQKHQQERQRGKEEEEEEEVVEEVVLTEEEDAVAKAPAPASATASAKSKGASPAFFTSTRAERELFDEDYQNERRLQIESDRRNLFSRLFSGGEFPEITYVCRPWLRECLQNPKFQEKLKHRWCQKIIKKNKKGEVVEKWQDPVVAQRFEKSCLQLPVEPSYFEYFAFANNDHVFATM